MTGVVVLGVDADAVAGRMAALRADGLRVAGFVGDDRDAAEAMATELFGEQGAVEALNP